MLAASYPFLDVLWTMFIFFLFFIWIWLLFRSSQIVFRRRDIGGGMKAVWFIFVILLPYLGVFIYLIAEGHKMADRDDGADAGRESAAGRLHQVGRRIVACRSDHAGEAVARQRRDHPGRVRHDEAKCAGFRVSESSTRNPSSECADATTRPAGSKRTSLTDGRPANEAGRTHE